MVQRLMTAESPIDNPVGISKPPVKNSTSVSNNAFNPFRKIPAVPQDPPRLLQQQGVQFQEEEEERAQGRSQKRNLQLANQRPGERVAVG